MGNIVLFDRFVNRYVIKGTLKAIDPIHIGNSGSNTLNPVDVDNSVLKDSRGYAIIPGSSLKGVVRSLFESVIRSVKGTEGYDKEYACDVMDNEHYCTSSVADELKNISEPRKKGLLAYEKSCLTCRLFGGREIAGRLMFKDCMQKVAEGESPIYEFRDGVGIDRDTGSAKNGAKFDYEIVPAGTEFDFCLIAENISDEQTKYLDFIIKQLRSGNVSVGGKTTRGLGRIMLVDDNYEKAKEQSTSILDDIKKALRLS